MTILIERLMCYQAPSRW